MLQLLFTSRFRLGISQKKFNTSVIANSRGESLELGRFSHLPTPGHQLWENGEELFLSLSLLKSFENWIKKVYF